MTLAKGLFILLLFSLSYGVFAETPQLRHLRVCSDPNNLPYSNRARQGFENKIAEVIAADLGLELEYTWFPQRMGFVRNTLRYWDEQLGRFRCDLIIGVPEEFDMGDTTETYYRSTYVMVLRSEGELGYIRSVQDLYELPAAQKQKIRIGAFAPSPSVDWLIRHELFENTEFYQVMTGDPDYYPGKIIEQELVPGKLDVVLIWGPIAGYFASTNPDSTLRIIPLTSQTGIRFDYAMAMGVRRGEPEWKARINKSLVDKREAILEILHEYRVPMVQTTEHSNTGQLLQ